MKNYFLTISVMILLSCSNPAPNKPVLNNDLKDSVDQLTSTKIFALLTAKNREWELDSTSVWLGSKCKKGELMSFSKDSVLHSACINGEWVRTKKFWQLLKEDSDLKIKIGEATYDLVMDKSESGKKDKMILSIISKGKEKTKMKMDKIFHSK
jgi:hypothetical protein